MKKKLLTIMTLILVVLIALTVIACGNYYDPDDEEDDPETINRTQIITNGTFYNAKSSVNKDTYIKDTVSGWSATKGSLATNANGVTMGVIDLTNAAAYNLQKDKFGVDDGSVFDNPGIDPKTPFELNDDGSMSNVRQDNNALILASKSNFGSVYYKNSSAFKLDAGKYYKLQFSVCTNIDMTDVAEADRDKKGAWVHITGGVEYVKSSINTDGKWETFVVYIEANKLASSTLDVRLWLGNGPEKIKEENNPYVTRGAAMFDNIICTEVTQAEDPAYNDGNSVELNNQMFGLRAAAATKDSVGYESMYYITDSKMEQTIETTPTSTNAINYYYSFREGMYTSTNVKNFNLVKGKTGLASTDYPTVTNAYTGIVDLSKLYASDATADSINTYSGLLPSTFSFTPPSYTKWKDTVMNGKRNLSVLNETKALMIFHNDLSGAGFTAKNALTVEKNKLYAVSVWVYVWAPVDKDGNFDYPKANAPTKPKELTGEEKRFTENFAGNKADGNPFYLYFDKLTDDEKKIVDGTVPVTPSGVPAIETILNSTEFQESLKNIYDADLAADGDATTIRTRFKYKHLLECLDSYIESETLQESDRAYLNYQYLVERNNNLSTWKPIAELNDKWDKYYDDYEAYMAKYAVWADNNQNPKATVKLTGAGEDISETTTTCNEGWEKLTFYIQGNQLSSRNLTLEYWFGEGSSTEYENLMFGGAFFDNVDIIEIAAEDKDHDLNWHVLSPITKEEELQFGGLTGEETVEDHWKNELAEGVSSQDHDIVDITSQTNTEIGQVNLGGVDVDLKELILTHANPTASILECLDRLTIKPNTAYRLALWVKTKDLDKGKTVAIDLMGGDKEDELASVANIGDFSKTEWTEVVFYIMGDSVKDNKVSLKFTMGTGSRFSTDTYVKGSLYIAVVNCTEIKYSEFSASSKSGDQVKSYTFANTKAASDSVTNGSFSSLDYSNTDKEEFEEASGKLVGVGTTSSWTKGNAKSNTFNTISLLAPEAVTGNTNQYKLKWEPVVGVDTDGKDTKPTHYEVYAKFLEDGKSVERLCRVIEANEDGNDFADGKFFTIVDMTGIKSTSFRVRAVSNKAVSSYSNFVTPPSSNNEGKVFITKADELENKKKHTAGTVSNNGLFDNSDYKSPFDTALKIESNYNIALSMSSSSKSLNANSFYKVSVWVMTEAGTKASVTVNDISNILSADVDKNFVGYVGIDTQGKWTQYNFYIKTGAASSSLSLELSLGNPYAIKSTKTSANVTTAVATYNDGELSQGAVYFDAVRVLTVEEKEYKDQLEKGEYNEDGSVRLHDFKFLYSTEKNQYAVRNLVYTTDSFDSFTENATAEDKDGYNLGHTPNNYDWSKSSDATGTTETERLYGVYNYKSDSDNKLQQLYNVTEDESEIINKFESFMPENFDIRQFVQMEGFNSLVMSNKLAYGQAYTTGSSTNINAATYYKLTFLAKTLIAREVKDGDDITYVTDGVNAEFRFMPNSSTEKYQSLLINSTGRTDNIYEAVEYTIYIYNPSATSSSAKWSFHLGSNEDDEDTTGTKQFVIGMMAIDQVSLTSITEDEFEDAKTAADYDGMSEEEQIKSAVRFYSYEKDKEPDDDDGGDEKPPVDKPSIFDRGDAWLLISSIVIALVIVIVVLVMLIRRWRKKHPREVVGENVAQTEKEIKVIVAENKRIDAEESDEFSDEIKPTYVQRTVKKGKKKKK